MTTYYKLTNDKDETYGKTMWGPGVTHTAIGDIAGGLCSDAYIYVYEHPLLAVLHDPIGANFGPTAHLWECKSDDEPLREGQMKLGVRSLTTLHQIPLPEITPEQRVRYAILCAKAVYTNPRWLIWADSWLDGTDRAARAAAESEINLIAIALEAVSQ